MLDQSQWRREVAARAGGSLSDAGRGTKTILDAQFIVQSLPGLEDTIAVAAAVEAGEGGLAASGFKALYPVGHHVIVMEAGDRSLHEIFQQERPGLNGTRTLFQQVVRAVAYAQGRFCAWRHQDAERGAAQLRRPAAADRPRLRDAHSEDAHSEARRPGVGPRRQVFVGDAAS
ncbi:hypothetical protein M885DRAFT_242460 [Pelagophyceae sp. CCMP2097]|nr:hypothetical protein M885DRAFT_242460 [Pelagophyceae sp. CCMP2097]